MWLIILGAIVLLLLLDWLRKSRAGPPVPQLPVWPVLGHAHLFGDPKNVDKTLDDIHKALGRPRVFKINLLGEVSVIVLDPEDCRVTSAVARSRAADWDDLVFFGRGISGLPAGDKHSALRKFFHPFINTAKHLGALEPTLRLHCGILVQQIGEHAKAGTFFDLQKLLEYSMFDLGIHIVFGFNPDTISGGSGTFWEDWEVQNDFTMGAMVARHIPYWHWIKTKWVRRWELSKERITALMLSYVQKCHEDCKRNPAKQPASILEYYFLSEKDAVCELSDAEIVIHALNFCWASIDSTRTTTCFSVVEAIRNPALCKELQRELDAEMPEACPTAAQVMDSLPRLQNWVSEVLRVHPTFAFTPALLGKAVRLHSDPTVVLPKGTIVTNFIAGMQLDSLNWHNASVFDPSRFEGLSATELKGFGPFGTGTRRCAGERLGLFDVRFFVAAVLRAFDFEAKKLEYETCFPLSKRIVGEYLVKATLRS